MRRPDFNRRVAVTGMGIISPVGSDLETVWGNLVAGRSGLRRITRFDPSPYEPQAAGEVDDFEPTKWMDFKAIRRTDKNVVFGVAVAKMALADSGLEVTDENRDDIGVIFGSGGGGPQLIMDNKTLWETKGARSVSPFFIANMLPDTASGQIAIETGIRGHNMCVVTACSTGTHNIGEAAEGIRRGDFIAAVAGATENPLHEIVHVGFTNMRGMGLPRPGEPIETVSRP
ncbi:MAG TPA: beta-ketoacyl synthase N-terminal-like domain-containing protein, partial [Candidatus Limnocylindrales bacterium]|nr:beta-ketoacyl synthase N-terminal-like domain-containing protein [Candidatus Limnocylindrales bacterium]